MQVLWLTDVCGYPRCSDACARATCLPDWRERLTWLTAARGSSGGSGSGNGIPLGSSSGMPQGGGGGGFPLGQDAVREAAMSGRHQALAWVMGGWGMGRRGGLGPGWRGWAGRGAGWVKPTEAGGGE